MQSGAHLGIILRRNYSSLRKKVAAWAERVGASDCGIIWGKTKKNDGMER